MSEPMMISLQEVWFCKARHIWATRLGAAHGISPCFLMLRPRTKFFLSIKSYISTAGSTPTATHMRLRYMSPSVGFPISWWLISRALSR